MKTLGTLSDERTCTMIYDILTTSPILQQQEDRQRRILDADYSKVDIDDMVNGLDIAKATKAKLKQTINKFPTVFGGGFGLLDVKPVDIELKPGSKPHASQYYSIPRAYDKVAKAENERLVTVDILKKLDHVHDSPWAAPSFCQMKKTGDVRFLTDFREVNKCIERKPFPLPRINESLQRIEKFKSTTALDLSQGYYSIPLSKKSQKICTTILPWGKYAYK